MTFSEKNARQTISILQARLDAALDLLRSLRVTTLYRLLRRLGRWSFLDARIEKVLQQSALAELKPSDESSLPAVNRDEGTLSLPALSAAIESFHASQLNAALLKDIRAYNHGMVDEFNRSYPLFGQTMLDIGASPHGYALEQAFRRGVSAYVGITLSLERPVYVRGETHQQAIILKMDATHLLFPSDYFDRIFSISTFEHILDLDQALAEIRRTLRPGGLAFISFEPLWSSPRGHHLHHFGECAKVMPDWAHLVWTPEQMNHNLTQQWPQTASISLEQAVNWVYYENDLNRKSLPDFRRAFETCGLQIKTWQETPAEAIQSRYIQAASQKTGLILPDLQVRGLTVVLQKV